MFKPHHATCIQCHQPSIVVVKAMLCAKCNYDNKQKKKKADGKSTAKYTYKRESTGEGALMESIVENLPDHETVCFVCGKRIAVLTYSNMAHMLPKGKYSAYRLYTDNIRILCFNLDGTGCHSRLDHQPKSTLTEEGWQKVFDLQEKLKKQYPEIK